MSLEGIELARTCVALVEDKKAINPVVLDLREISTVADFFVICSADNEPQLKAIANSLTKTLKDEHDTRPAAVDGHPFSQWIVIDYIDVMVHVFHAEKRDFYALEELWSDAPRIETEPSETPQ